MRLLALVLVVPFVGCGSAGQSARDLSDAQPDAGGDAGSVSSEPPTFQIVSANLDVEPHGDVTFCFYFKTSNTTDVSIKRWVSRMSPGTRQMILYLTSSKERSPGTLSDVAENQCGLEASGGSAPAWAYSARTADAELVMPSDDGEGNPVGYLVHAGQYGFIQMHYVNDSDATIHAHVELDAYAYASGVQVTRAGTFATYNREITLKPATTAGPTPATVQDACTVIADQGQTPKFFAMTTQTFKQGVHTAVKDGSTTVFESTNWAKPGSASWNPPRFYVFSSGKLTYQCDYLNPTTGTITLGDNPAKDENCMAVGYYFPYFPQAKDNDNNGHFCMDHSFQY